MWKDLEITQHQHQKSQRNAPQRAGWQWMRKGAAMVLLCICASAPAGLHAQMKPVDSLRQVLDTMSRDTHRVTLLCKLSDMLNKFSYSDALPPTLDAIDLADSLHDKKGLANALWRKGSCQYHLGALELATKAVLEAYMIFESIGDHTGMARTMLTLGAIQTQLRQYDKAIKTLILAEVHFKAADNYRGAILAKHSLAVAYSEKGDSVSAKALYYENLRHPRIQEYTMVLAFTYTNLGNLFDLDTQGDSAIYYYERGLQEKISSKSTSYASIGLSYMNLAAAYREQGNYALAQTNLQAADSLISDAGEKRMLVDLYQGWGTLLQKQGRYMESTAYFRKLAELQDSLFTPEMTEQATNLEVAYQNEAQKREIVLLNKSKALDLATKERWQWISIAAIGFLSFSIILLVLLLRRNRERNRMMQLIEEKSEEIKRQQTEILQQNQALTQQNQHLARVNREKDELIGVVAHDIRAPLNKAAALIDLIGANGGLNAVQQGYSDLVKKVTADGSRLIEELLELHSLESEDRLPEIQPVDLARLVDQSLHGQAGASAQKGIEILVTTASTMAKTDEKLLGRILDNLLSNAVKFTPKGKKIYIGISTDADRHWISIRDEGPGIGPDDQKKMFQKFMRLSARPTGGESSTGLGLSIVRALADKIGVELAFESALGAGTTFKVGVRKVG